MPKYLRCRPSCDAGLDLLTGRSPKGNISLEHLQCIVIAVHVEVGPAGVVIQRPEPSLRSRIFRGFRHTDGFLVPAKGFLSLLRDSEHMRRIHGVKLETRLLSQFQSFTE